MSTYLIDFENVKSAGLTGIDRIAPADCVHLFWSTRENKISIEMMELIRKSKSLIEMHKASTGERDALDHQLCSYLGYLAGQEKDKVYVIISNDKAYDHLIEFWKGLRPDIKISRVNEIGKAIFEAPRKKAEPVKEINKEVVKEPVKEVAKETIKETVKEAEVKEEKQPVTMETVVTENKNQSRNQRRRDRASRYLRGRRKHAAEGEIRENSADYVLTPAPVDTPDPTFVAEVTVMPVKEELPEVKEEVKEEVREEVKTEEKPAEAKETVEAVLEAPVLSEEETTEEVPAEVSTEESVSEETEETSSEVLEEAEEVVATDEETEEVKEEASEEAPVLDFYAEPLVEENTPSIVEPVTSVVSKFTSSVIVESGFTATGIMEEWTAPVLEETAVSEKEETAEEVAIPAAEETVMEEVVTMEAATEEVVTEEAVTEVVVAEEALAEEAVEEVVTEEAEAEAVKEEAPAEKPKRKRTRSRRNKKPAQEVSTEENTEVSAEVKAETAEKTEAKEENPGKPAPRKQNQPKERKPVTREKLIAFIPEAAEAEWTEDVLSILNSNPANRVYNPLRSRVGRKVDFKDFYSRIKALFQDLK